jgi:CTD nuclear envelope phosphatase 1
MFELKSWLVTLSSFMIRHVQTGLRAVLLFLTKIWNFIVFVAKKEARVIVQHQAVRYDLYPLSPITRHRLSEYVRPSVVN